MLIEVQTRTMETGAADLQEGMAEMAQRLLGIEPSDVEVIVTLNEQDEDLIYGPAVFWIYDHDRVSDDDAALMQLGMTDAILVWQGEKPSALEAFGVQLDQAS